MNTNKIFVSWISCLLTLGIIFGCSSPTQPADSHTTQTHTELLATTIPTTVQSQIPSTAILIPSQTHTQVSTPSVTPTLLPTMEPDDAMELVLSLLENNGECQLPCWWGHIYPGETQWTDAKRYLETFAKEINFVGQDGDLLLYGVDFRVPKSVRYHELLEVSIDVKGGLVTKIFIGQPYPIERIFNDLGKPTEIWIHAVSSDTILEKGWYSLVLFWPEKGVLAVYDGTNKKTNPIEICLDTIDRTTTALWLWAADLQQDFFQIGVRGDLRLLGEPPIQEDYYLLDTATEIDTNMFFEEFGKLGYSFCFFMQDPDLP